MTNEEAIIYQRRSVSNEIWTVKDFISSDAVPKHKLHINVDKRGAKIRFENETEDAVTIVVEPK